MFNKLKKVIKIGTENDSNRVSWIKEKLKNLPAGLRILDAGAGEQRFKKFCNHLKYVSQDFAQYNGKGDNVGLQMGSWNNNNLDIISDIVKIPEPDASFDVILCTEVLEHIPEPVSAIKEFSRLLKRGGQLIITAPFCCGTHFAPYFFYTGFSPYFYKKYLAENGFEIIEVKVNGNFFDYVAQEIRRTPTIARMYANKTTYPWEYFIFFLTLLILRKFSKKAQKSSEFLNYGIFIHAIKK